MSKLLTSLDLNGPCFHKLAPSCVAPRALAMIYPDEPGRGGRGNNTEATKAAETAGFAGRRIREARAVLRHSSRAGNDLSGAGEGRAREEKRCHKGPQNG